MATYREIWALRQDAGFLQQISVAFSAVFRDIRNENVLTANHANRLTLAYKDPDRIAQAASWDVVANPTLQAGAPNPSAIADSDILFVVTQLVNDPNAVDRYNAET